MGTSHPSTMACSALVGGRTACGVLEKHSVGRLTGSCDPNPALSWVPKVGEKGGHWPAAPAARTPLHHAPSVSSLVHLLHWSHLVVLLLSFITPHQVKQVAVFVVLK